jgi:hypothetical protein
MPLSASALRAQQAHLEAVIIHTRKVAIKTGQTRVRKLRPPRFIVYRTWTLEIPGRENTNVPTRY